MDFNTSFGDALELITGKLDGWLKTFIEMLPNMVVALLIVIAFVFLARGARWLFRKYMNRGSGHNINLLTIGGNIIYVMVLLVGLFMALEVLNLEKTVTSILAGAGVIGLALGFAFQDTASNFISGLMIAFRKPFEKGDFVETNDYMGTVKEINIRSIIVETVNGLEVIIPNKEVFQNPLTNYTSTQKRRVDISCGVGYADDLDKAERVAIEAVKDLPSIDNDNPNPITLMYTEFGDSSINFTIRVWLKQSAQLDYLTAKSEAIKRIKKAFDSNDISIPFPIRTLDFGIEGGLKLNEVLSINSEGNMKPKSNAVEE